MKLRRSRALAFGVLAMILLTGFGVVSWKLLADYRAYRQFITLPSLPDQKLETSIEEFLLYRRTVRFYDFAERLAAKKAAAEEVRAELGEPDHVSQREEHGVESWFYSGPVFRGHQSETIVVRFDIETLRVSSVAYIHHN